MGKTISSREDDPGIVEILQDGILIVEEVFSLPAKETDLSGGIRELADRLHGGVTTLAVSHTEIKKELTNTTGELVSLAIANVRLGTEIKKAISIIHDLASPCDEDALMHAYNVLKHEGNADICLISAELIDDDFSLPEVEIKFSDENLIEALRVAIGEYNNKAASKILD